MVQPLTGKQFGSFKKVENVKLLCTPQARAAGSLTTSSRFWGGGALTYTVLTSIMAANSFPSASNASSEFIKFLLVF